MLLWGYILGLWPAAYITIYFWYLYGVFCFCISTKYYSYISHGIIHVFMAPFTPPSITDAVTDGTLLKYSLFFIAFSVSSIPVCSSPLLIPSSTTHQFHVHVQNTFLHVCQVCPLCQEVHLKMNSPSLLLPYCPNSFHNYFLSLTFFCFQFWTCFYFKKFAAVIASSI